MCKNLTAQSGETQEFLEAERLTMCEELTILHSAARQSMFQQDTEMHAISGAVKLLWEKFHDTINVLSIRSGKETSQHLMALKRRKLLASESLVDRVLAGKMKKSLTSNSDEWGEETYVGYGHLMSRIVKLQEMVADLQDLASWKQLRDRIDVLDKEKSELNSELEKCQMRLQHSLKNLDETKQNLKRRDEQYMELEETIMGSRLEQELQRMKEKKQHYKDRLKELTGFGEEYQCHMERKVELLKSNLAKAEAEVQSLDHIVEHARKTLHVCHGVVKTNPKLEKLLHYLDGTITVE
jgi:chromosome segregation ATPase